MDKEIKTSMDMKQVIELLVKEVKQLRKRVKALEDK